MINFPSSLTTAFYYLQLPNRSPVNNSLTYLYTYNWSPMEFH